MNATAKTLVDSIDGEESHRALLTLEALRLGVVPDTDLDAYTVGREAEMEVVDADLKKTTEGGAVRAFLGEYGAGKTHLLELIRERARAQNFVTARVVLNPEETAPSHPKRVYRELVRSLEYPDIPTGQAPGLRPLIEKAATNEEVIERFEVLSTEKTRENLDEGAHLYLTPALRYFRSIELGEKNAARRKKVKLDDDARSHGLSLLFNWLEGHPTISNVEIDDELRHMVGRQDRIYSMKDYRPWARIYGYIISGLATLTRQVGYSGLVVLIDEAEFYALLSSQNREFARILLKALAWASIGGDESLVPFSREELELGGMGILRDLPPRYGRQGGLYTVFAMTPNTQGLDALAGALPEDGITEISRLEMEDYRALVSRVTAHYRHGRPGANIAEAMEGALSKVVSGLLHSGYIENPRQAMKFVVEFLDLATFRPDDMRQVVGDLREIYG